MSSSLVVPVIDVHNDNFKELWPAMVVAIKTSSFVALDTELSGLGNRKSLLAESVEDRYKAICHAARSRSILSLGIACYKKQDLKGADTYLVQVYNLTLLCSEEYIIEPQSVQFLVQHGFDFNKQYAQGISYLKGNNKGGLDYHGVHIRALFTELLRAKKPLVFHNGLIDMVFLYQCFYAHLPERLATFTADLSEMFPAGIYDTKYVTEFELRFTASYLEYAYKKCKLDNSRSVTSGGAGRHVHVDFCQYAGLMSSYVDYRECPVIASPEGHSEVCECFSAFGYCPNGNQCPLSHDTDLIILQDEQSKNEKRKKRKRQREKKKGGGDAGVAEGSSVFDGAPEKKTARMEVEGEEEKADQQGDVDLCAEAQTQRDGEENGGKDLKTETEENGADGGHTDSNTTITDTRSEDRDSKVNTDDSEKNPTVSEGSRECSQQLTKSGELKKAETGTHRAGFDAFMTGYIFAYSCTLVKQEGKKEEEEEKKQEQEESWHPACLNKVYLSGKAVPLNVMKSTFSKSSKAHVQKMETLWGRKM